MEVEKFEAGLECFKAQIVTNIKAEEDEYVEVTWTDKDRGIERTVDVGGLSNIIGAAIVPIPFMAGLEPEMRLIVISDRGRILMPIDCHEPPIPDGIKALLDVLQSRFEAALEDFKARIVVELRALGVEDKGSQS
jgi:hypothetical protein